MPKNKTIRGLTILFASTLLWGCASKKADEDPVWASTDDIYSSASITSSKASIGANGDIFIIWQEQETQVRNDTAKDEAHQFLGTGAAVDSHAFLHSHKSLYTKTTVNVRRYDSSAGNWNATVPLKAGYWEKTRTGLLDIDATDESEIVYEENVNNTFVGAATVSVNSSGNAIAVWVQLGESSVTTGDASTVHSMFVSLYNPTTNSWSASSIITGAVVVQNTLDVSLNDANIVHLVWLGRDDLTFKVNAYQNVYDGNTWSSTTMLSDGNSTVRDIQLIRRNQNSGVAVWSQYAAKTTDVDSETCDQANFNATPLNLVSNWFNATAWHTVPQVISGVTGDVKDFSVATNNGGSVWTSWTQTSNANYPCGAGGSRVTDVSTVKASQFSNDIDADITAGMWSAAANIQPDIAATTLVDESNLNSAQTSIAVDASGNVVVAWVEVGDGKPTPSSRTDSIIRANRYKAGSWLAESFIVSDTALFAADQPIEKTIPNDHVAPNVVATAANQFTISWQYWRVSAEASGYQMFSVDYDAGANTSSPMATVSEAVSPVVNQMDVFSVDGQVQMLWSQEKDLSTRLKKSVK